jgi:putative phosphoribosyl transferase
VAYEVARSLHAPLEPLVVRKIGAPQQPELAVGALASGGVRTVNAELKNELQIPDATLERLFQEETLELERREQLYRGGRPFPDVSTRTVVLVDDGLATGATMIAAVQTMRKLGARRVIVAVPIGSPEILSRLRAHADECVCVVAHFPLRSVGEWYDDFTQTSDEEVLSLVAANKAWISKEYEKTSAPELRY